MKQRICYLIETYLLTVVIFIAAKVGFMLYNAAAHPVGIGDMMDVIGHGITLDLSTSIYFILLPLLLILISLWWQGWKLIRKIILGYDVIVTVALALSLVSDTCLYEFWGFKLNNTALSYLSQPEGITSSVSFSYLLVRAIALLLIGAAIFWLHRWILPKQLPVQPIKQQIIGTIIALALPYPLIIGIRGGVTESTTNVGQVYFSQNQYLNHAAVNPFFSFISSLEHGADEYDLYNYYDEKTCQQLVKDIYNTQSIDSDTLLTTSRPNVVIVLMESCGAMFTELNGHPEITPNLSKLAREGINFTNCYANSWRTDRGTVCTLSGYPSFPKFSVMKIPEKCNTLPSIAKTLQHAGYTTSYLYGGDINFTNMKGYLIGTGYDRLTSMDNYTKKEQTTSKWGVQDDITCQTLYQMIIRGKGHYLIGYSTLSSHEPWDVPVKKFKDPVINSFYYLDQCIGQTVEKLKKTPQWKNLLMIFLPDHSIIYGGYDESKLMRNQIPMIWIGGAVKKHRNVQTLCNQTDLPATLLGQMRLNHSDFKYSRDVFSRSYRYPTAVNTFNNGIMYIDSTGYMTYDFDANAYIIRKSKSAQEQLRRAKAIMQTAATDLKNR